MDSYVRPITEMPSKQRPYRLFLPLWKRVVFIDWFGVLSTDLFWHSILGQSSHPYRRIVERVSDHLFRSNRDLVKDWMRGRVTSESLLNRLDVQLDRRCKTDYLLRKLLEDCRRMRFSAELIEGVRAFMPDSHILIATDNMDCFTIRASFLRDQSIGIDDVLVSSELGVLKTDSIEAFFGPWLSDHDLKFSDALLIDDNAATCDRFRSCGGDAIHFFSLEQTLAALRERKAAEASAILPRSDRQGYGDSADHVGTLR